MADRDLIVRVLGDDRDFQRAIGSSERRLQAFSSRMTGVNQGMRGFLSGFGSRTSLLFGSGAFLSTAGITAGIRQTVDAASDLNEQVSKSRQVFRDSSGEIERWSRTTAASFGISQREALAATGTFGNLFRVIEIAPQRAGEMSRALVELAADLASFNNANPEEVLLALRSGLIGEAEPLRRFGVLLSEARVQQIALANTGKSSAEALTDQEKAMGRFEIIMRDTASAQGDFARTQEGLANQSRILRAELNDLSASIGRALLPTITSLVGGLNVAIGGISELGGALDRLGGQDFESANASLAELVERAETFGRLDFDLPSVQELIPRIRAISEEFNRIGATDRVVAAFRQASTAIDAALQDGVLTPLERAQLETDELGQLFLSLVPADVLGGLGAAVRSNIEDATAAARTGIADTGAEIRSGIEDMSRQAVVEARKGGEDVGNAFVEGLQAASARIEGQVAGLGEQVLRAQISGDEQAELGALRRQQERLRRQLEIQENIVAQGGAGAATARRRIREQILPQLLAVSNAIDAILEERDRRLEETRRNAEQKNEEARRKQRDILDNRREQQELVRQQRQERQFEQLGLTGEGQERVPGAGALRRRLGSLQEQVRGTSLDTEQTRTQLDRIRRVLAGKFGEVGRDVRRAILAMFNDISDALDEGTGRDGPLTRFQKTGANKLLEGLGLSAEEIKALRQRLAQVGPGGTVPGQGIGAFGFNVTAGGGGGNIIVHGDIRVDGGNPDAIVRAIEKRTQRTAGQRRGTRPGGR